MPNANYEGGVAFEREVRKHLESEGYWCARAAGSKGKADLIAIKPGEVLIVQCKRNGTLPPDERVEVRRIAALLPGIGVPLLARRPGITFRKLTGNGPQEWEPWCADYAETGDSDDRL